jgi:3-methyladenine DNA glycosylase/8-oxoguanine DNA glycosylase
LAPFNSTDGYTQLTFVDRLASGKVVECSIQESAGGALIETRDGLSSAEEAELVQKVTWMLGLDQDFTSFYASVREEPKLAHAQAGARGRVLRCPTFFEDIVKTILTTNTLWAATIRMNGNLVSLYGEPLPEDPSRRAFPTPERLAALDESTLRGEARLGYRAPYILELARQVAAGELDVEAFKTTPVPTLELRKELMRIKGVGGYAAANLLMLLGRYDFIPVDSWALKMVSHEWYAGEAVEPATVEAAFERWGEWKGLAVWFWDWAYKG